MAITIGFFDRHHLVTDGARHYGRFRRGMGTLETELHRLTWLNGAIPAQVGGGVGIVASDIGVPAPAEASVAAISPAHVPIVDRASATVGNADRPGKPTAPIVGDHITAVPARCRCTGGDA